MTRRLTTGTPHASRARLAHAISARAALRVAVVFTIAAVATANGCHCGPRVEHIGPSGPGGSRSAESGTPRAAGVE